MRTAAIFDLDGTLLVGATTESTLLRYLARRRQIGVWGVLGWIRGFFFGLPYSWNLATKENKGYLTGNEKKAVLSLARECFAIQLVPRISAKAVATIAWHTSQGHMTGILSGSPDFLVELFRAYLGLDFGCGTLLATQGAYFTGKIAGLHPYAERKVSVLEKLLRIYHIEPACSYGYANHYTDRFFLQMFGHPTAVNPDKRLRRYARAHGWPIRCFD